MRRPPRKPKLTVINKSRWPTPALQVLAKWIVKRAGINGQYRVIVRSCRTQSWGGRGWSDQQRVWSDRHYRRAECHITTAQAQAQLKRARQHLGHYLRKLRDDGWLRWPYRDNGGHYKSIDALRGTLDGAVEALDKARRREAKGASAFKRMWPYSHKDHRFQWSDNFELRTRLELLVMLIAHEAHHAVDGGRSKYMKGDRCDVAAMEYRCNKFAYETIEDLREQWPTLRARIYKAMRAERARQRKAKAEKARRRSPEHKLQLARDAVERWKRKRDSAAKAIAKHQKRVRYYEGRVAAKTKGTS